MDRAQYTLEVAQLSPGQADCVAAKSSTTNVEREFSPFSAMAEDDDDLFGEDDTSHQEVCL